MHPYEFDPEHWHRAGHAFQSDRRLESALTCYSQASSLDPGNGQYHASAAAVLVQLKRDAEGIARYEQALRCNARDPAIHNNLAHALLRSGDVAGAVAACREALQLRPAYPKAHSNLLLALQFRECDAEALFREHQSWALQNGIPAALRTRHENNRDPERPLRIGYVSANFGPGHPVRIFLEPVLRNHYSGRFVAACYSNRGPIPDSLPAPVCRDITRLSDGEADCLIRRDRIDILVDLGGHFPDNRLTLFARKPAPVQVTWLAYPNTTGLPAIDYRITDAIADPRGKTESLHSETLLRLPGRFLCYGPPEAAPEFADLPRSRSGTITLGSFNHPLKIAPGVIECWAEILRRLPGSRLLFHHAHWEYGDIRSRILREFSRIGIAQDRLEWVGSEVSHVEHLGVYARADLALDTFPYNGTTTTCEALWMGVPVVTLAGERHISRVGKSLLAGLDLGKFVADTPAGYVELAVRAAIDVESLQSLRSELRTKMAAGRLTNGARFTRHLERVYRWMWRRWCAKSEER